MQHITVEQLHRALGGEIRRGKNGPCVVCPGPGHSHADRSLAVSPANNADGFLVHSFAGDDPISCKDFIRDKAGLDPFRPHNGKGHLQPKPQRVINKTYEYTDEAGQPLFQVVRYEPKGFYAPVLNNWDNSRCRPCRIPARGDVTVSAVAELPGLFVSEFEAQRTVLRDQGFPEPDPIRPVGGHL